MSFFERRLQDRLQDPQFAAAYADADLEVLAARQGAYGLCDFVVRHVYSSSACVLITACQSTATENAYAFWSDSSSYGAAEGQPSPIPDYAFTFTK